MEKQLRGPERANCSDPLRKITISNYTSFHKVIAEHFDEIPRLPAPPPMFFNIGPLQKKFSVSNCGFTFQAKIPANENGVEPAAAPFVPPSGNMCEIPESLRCSCRCTECFGYDYLGKCFHRLNKSLTCYHYRTPNESPRAPDEEPLPGQFDWWLPISEGLARGQTALYGTTHYALQQRTSADRTGPLVEDSSDTHRRRGMHAKILEYRALGTKITDSTLRFESRFESGNLLQANRIPVCTAHARGATETAQGTLQLPVKDRLPQVTGYTSAFVKNSTGYGAVFKPHDQHYFLLIRPDTSSTGNTQWFYFAVGNTLPGIPYTFTIANFTKSFSQYQRGMQPLIFSEVDHELNNTGWARTGTNIVYALNQPYVLGTAEPPTDSRYNTQLVQGQGGSMVDTKSTGSNSERTSVYDIPPRGSIPSCPSGRGSVLSRYYSLTFTVTFRHAGDVCYLAHCYPYTYTRLQTWINSLIHKNHINTQSATSAYSSRSSPEATPEYLSSESENVSGSDHVAPPSEENPIAPPVKKRKYILRDYLAGDDVNKGPPAESDLAEKTSHEQQIAEKQMRKFVLLKEREELQRIIAAEDYCAFHELVGASSPSRSSIPMLSQRVLAKTLGHNDIDIIGITAPTNSRTEFFRRKTIVITSRIHPGETQASFMVEGLVEFLLSDNIVASILRRLYVFKIICMVNPDGVVVGNYRCNLAGYDLNRTWMNPSKDFHPCVYAIRSFVKGLSADYTAADTSLTTYIEALRAFNSETFLRSGADQLSLSMAKLSSANLNMPSNISGATLPQCHRAVSTSSLAADSPSKTRSLLTENYIPQIVAATIDLHGHSKKCNVFGYACTRVPGLNSYFVALNNLSSYFSLGDCHFEIGRSKETTCRAVMHRTFGISRAFTIEATFSGVSKPGSPMDGMQMTQADMRKAGADIGFSLIYLDTCVLSRCKEFLQTKEERLNVLLSKPSVCRSKKAARDAAYVLSTLRALIQEAPPLEKHAEDYAFAHLSSEMNRDEQSEESNSCDDVKIEGLKPSRSRTKKKSKHKKAEDGEVLLTHDTELQFQSMLVSEMPQLVTPVGDRTSTESETNNAKNNESASSEVPKLKHKRLITKVKQSLAARRNIHSAAGRLARVPGKESTGVSEANKVSMKTEYAFQAGTLAPMGISAQNAVAERLDGTIFERLYKNERKRGHNYPESQETILSSIREKLASYGAPTTSSPLGNDIIISRVPQALSLDDCDSAPITLGVTDSLRNDLSGSSSNIQRINLLGRVGSQPIFSHPGLAKGVVRTERVGDVRGGSTSAARRPMTASGRHRSMVGPSADYLAHALGSNRASSTARLDANAVIEKVVAHKPGRST